MGVPPTPMADPAERASIESKEAVVAAATNAETPEPQQAKPSVDATPMPEADRVQASGQSEEEAEEGQGVTAPAESESSISTNVAVTGPETQRTPTSATTGEIARAHAASLAEPTADDDSADAQPPPETATRADAVTKDSTAGLTVAPKPTSAPKDGAVREHATSVGEIISAKLGAKKKVKKKKKGKLKRGGGAAIPF